VDYHRVTIGATSTTSDTFQYLVGTWCALREAEMCVLFSTPIQTPNTSSSHSRCCHGKLAGCLELTTMHPRGSRRGVSHLRLLFKPGRLRAELQLLGIISHHADIAVVEPAWGIGL